MSRTENEKRFDEKWYLTNSRPISKIEPKPKVQPAENESKLKVIAWKLPQELLDEISKSIKEQKTASISEFSRTAIFDLLQMIIDNQITDMEISDTLEEIDMMQSRKVSACAKMPVNFLKIVDEFVKQKKMVFINRTNLIRIAIKIGLETEKQLYSYWNP